MIWDFFFHETIKPFFFFNLIRSLIIRLFALHNPAIPAREQTLPAQLPVINICAKATWPAAVS